MPATDSGALDPNGSSVAYEKRTLWVAYDGLVDAFSADSSGSVTPEKSIGSIQWTSQNLGALPGIVDVAIAPDGTKYLLEQRDFAEGGRGWRLFAIAPGDTQQENVYGDDINFPIAVSLAGDGIMVHYSTPQGTHTIATFAYAASNSLPIRLFQSTNANNRVDGFAAGADGRLYVERPQGFDVYHPDANGFDPPERHITTDTPLQNGPQGFAVGPDNSIYVEDLTNALSSSHVMYVNVYPEGSGTIARRIGPLPTNYDALGHSPVIIVDSQNRLFVATNGQIYRFGPKANGNATPQRVFVDSTRIENPTAMAVGPRTL